MTNIIPLPKRSLSVDDTKRPGATGTVVPMQDIDLPTVVDMVGCLRRLGDPRFLDEFNFRNAQASLGDGHASKRA